VRRVALALGLLLTALAVPAPAPPAAAAAAQEPGPSLEVTELGAVLRPGGAISLRGLVTNPAAEPSGDLRLVATLQRRTTDRADYQRALDQGLSERGGVARVTVPVGSLPPGGSAPVELQRSAQELGLGNVPDRLAGVYPLRLELRDGDGPVDVVTTSVVALPEVVGEPVRFALVAPLDSAIALPEGDTYAADPLAGGLAGDDPRLPAIAGELAAAPEIPLTLATSGAVLAQAAEAAGGYVTADAAGPVAVAPADPPAAAAGRLVTDVTALLRRPPVEHVALPYASADLVALVRAGQPAAAQEAVGEGVRSAEERTGDRPAAGVLLPPDGIDRATLDVLVPSTDAVILDADNTADGPAPAAGRTPSPVRSVRTSDGQALAGLVADPWLSPLLAGTPDISDEGPVLAAQRLVGETAAHYFELPFAPERRGVLVQPPRLFDPPDGMLAAVVAAVAAAPWLEPVTVPGLLAEVAPGPEPLTLAYPEDALARELPVPYLRDVAEARSAVGTLANLLTTADPSPPASSIGARLQVVTGVGYRGAQRQDEGRAVVTAALRGAEEVFASVRVEQGPQILLTSARGSVPVTVTNTAPVPLSVRVTVTAPLQRFAFPDPPQPDGTCGSDQRSRWCVVQLEAGSSRTVEFEAEALTPGSIAPIDVAVSDPGGQRRLAYGRVVVRSQTSSVVAIAVTAGAGLFLALWWVREVRRGRRTRAGAAAEGRGRREVVA